MTAPVLADIGNFFENASLIAVVLPIGILVGLLAERALGVTEWFVKRNR